MVEAFLLAQIVKNPPVTSENLDSIPGWGRSPGEGNGNPFQYSCLENPMDGGAWRATVHGVAKLDMTELLNNTAYCGRTVVLHWNFYKNHLGNLWGRGGGWKQ